VQRPLRLMVVGVSILLMALARVGGAQELRGTVTDSVSGVPIAGAVSRCSMHRARCCGAAERPTGQYRIATDSMSGACASFGSASGQRHRAARDSGTR
jgi:hypothetical protein